jgi:hypothetical protein
MAKSKGFEEDMVRVLFKIINVMNIKKLFNFSHHNLNKSIVTLCIAKYENAYHGFVFQNCEVSGSAILSSRT